jgi:hypothetical protein
MMDSESTRYPGRRPLSGPGTEPITGRPPAGGGLTPCESMTRVKEAPRFLRGCLPDSSRESGRYPHSKGSTTRRTRGVKEAPPLPSGGPSRLLLTRVKEAPLDTVTSKEE